jgi:hypothetical protein
MAKIWSMQKQDTDVPDDERVEDAGLQMEESEVVTVPLPQLRDTSCRRVVA